MGKSSGILRFGLFAFLFCLNVGDSLVAINIGCRYDILEECSQKIQKLIISDVSYFVII